MRCSVSFLSFVCFMSASLVYVSCAPAGDASFGLQISGGTTPGSGGGLGGLTNILSQIDLPGLLRGVNSFVKLVGVFCPPLSQVLDNVIQNVTSTAFRVFGRAILQGGGLGGGNSGGGGGQRVSVVLPTFPPDEEDYEDEETTEENAQINNRNGDDVATTTVIPESDGDSNKIENNADNPGTLYTSSSADEDSNVIKRHTRVVREAEADDQVGAESAPNPQDLSDVDVEDDQDRDKRYTAFGGTAEGHGGGSGNFLFDIIRVSMGS